MTWLRLLGAALVLAILAVPAAARPYHGDDRWAGVSEARSPGYSRQSRVKRSKAKRRHVRKAQARKARRAAVRHRGTAKAAQRAPARAVAAIVETASAGLAKPARFISGSLKCAVNVGSALAARGIQGTGSALAKSYLRWGRESAPVPGAVAVYHRGSRRSGSGHVAIVAKVENGRVLVWNPSRRGWRLQAYRRRAIAYRVAG
jgi:hypothetical protein